MEDIPAPDPMAALTAARRAAERGDDSLALNAYEHLFDHALDDDSASFYGVRLSYCLIEWAELGRRHPPALAGLVQRRDAAWTAFEADGDPDQFGDFAAICRALGHHGLLVTRFRTLDAAAPDAARVVGWFVWDELVADEDWSLANAQLDDVPGRLRAEMDIFDVARSMKRERQVDDEAATSIERLFVRNMSSVLRVLERAGRSDEATITFAHVACDLAERGCAELAGQIRRQWR